MTDRQIIPKITKDDIGNVITQLASSFNEELFSKGQEELEQYWHFKWDNTMSLVWNLYQFYDMLGLYEGFCRRWEEHHNGSCCVVERVRDKYLMPKIKEFATRLEA